VFDHSAAAVGRGAIYRPGACAKSHIPDRVEARKVAALGYNVITLDDLAHLSDHPWL
jgi:hypothetical protein